MSRWVSQVVNQTRDLFADRGGPIILGQIENELGSGDVEYTQWAGDLAQSLDVDIVWGMCNGETATNTVNTCNGNDCTQFLEKHGQNGRVLIDQPAIWTENEEWYLLWGDNSVVAPDIDSYFHRSAEDQAYSISRWFARGGSMMNYYMYFGFDETSLHHQSSSLILTNITLLYLLLLCSGNTYERWVGAGVTTAYEQFSNLMSDGFPNEPKYSHLSRLHHVIRDIAAVVVNRQAQLNNFIPLQYYNESIGKWTIGTEQVAFIYDTITFIESSSTVFNPYSEQETDHL
jgi:hypothetical protein